MAQEPYSCIQTKINSNTVILGTTAINLSAIARIQGIDLSYLSRIFSGKRDPGQMSVKQAMKLAGAVGMGLEEFISALYERQEKLSRMRAIVRQQQKDRMRSESVEDANLIRHGRIPAPRLPLIGSMSNPR